MHEVTVACIPKGLRIPAYARGVVVLLYLEKDSEEPQWGQPGHLLWHAVGLAQTTTPLPSLLSTQVLVCTPQPAQDPCRPEPTTPSQLLQ